METIELRTLLRPLFRWWWLIVAATLIAGISSLVYTLMQPSVYESRTTLVVGSSTTDPNPNGNDIYLAQQLAQTYADIAMREPIQTAALAELNAEWLPFYTVQMLPNTPIVEIRVIDQDPAFARDVASVLAKQLILQGPAGREKRDRQDFVDQQLERLQVSIVETQDEVVQKQAELAALFSAREIANLENQINALDNKLSTLQSNYAALLATTQKGASNAISILEPADLPQSPVASQLLVNVLVAAIVGLALASGGAYLLDFLDDSLKDADDVQQLLGIPPLASVPELLVEQEQDKLVMLSNTPNPAAEAYRMLRTNLQFASVDRPLKMLLITSPAPGEGKSLTAANLAAAYTRAGKRVILVDADLHRPSQQRFFRLHNNVGLTLALFDDKMTLEGLLQDSELPGLRIMTTGPLPPNPAELLGSRRMQEILGRLRDQADIIIIDSPPVSAVSDALILASQADGVLLIVKSGKTSRTVAKKALATLRQAKTQLIGAVYNGVSAQDSDYTYDYAYSYYETEESPEPAQPMIANGNGNSQNNGHNNGHSNGQNNGYGNAYGAGYQDQRPVYEQTDMPGKGASYGNGVHMTAEQNGHSADEYATALPVGQPGTGTQRMRHYDA